MAFTLVWIGLYVVVMNIALQFCEGFDDLSSKTAQQVMVPVIYICALAVFQQFGSFVTVFPKNSVCAISIVTLSGFSIPLIIMSCVNLKNGLGLNAPAAVSLLMMVNLAVAGYVEEIVFRGFLFWAMAKDNPRSAIIVSAITFGAGHVVNLANTAAAPSSWSRSPSATWWQLFLGRNLLIHGIKSRDFSYSV